jgi:PAS domain S-box-containing protein
MAARNGETIKINKSQSTLRMIGAVLLSAALAIILYFIGRSDYPLFHSMVDGATILIAATVFVVVWNGRHILDNHYFLFVGIALLFFLFLDFMHLLGNKGMGVFTQYGNLGPTFYIASRYVLSISLVLAPLFIKRKLNTVMMFSVYTLATSFVMLSVFYWRIFPVTYIEGTGLTPFKVISDYIICLILAGAIGLLVINRRAFDSRVLRTIIVSLVLSIASGLSFTLYTDPFGVTNAVGHFFQIASFSLVYLAFVETSLTKPQNILYRSLQQSNDEITKLNTELENTNFNLSQDVEKRKKAEEALRESEARFRLSLRNAPVSVAAQNLDLKFLWAYNQRTIDPADVVGKNDFDIFAVQDAEKLVALKRSVIKTGNDYRGQMWLTSNGKRVFLDLILEPIKDAAGNITGVGIATVDLTQQKLLEESLELEKDKLINTLNSMEDGVCIMDKDFNLEYINPSLQSDFGSIENQKCHKYFNARDNACPWCNNREVLSGGQTVRREVHSSKTRKTYEVTETLLSNTDGGTSKLAVWHDITERKKVDQIKDEFISMISHELKTPITVIMGALSTASDERVPLEEARMLIGDAVIHSEILANLVDNLLELSRQQSGRLTVLSEPVDVSEAAQKVIRKLDKKSAKHILNAVFEPQLPAALADPLRVERILYNLIDNAIKYSPDGGEVNISARQEGKFLLVSVHDHGPGISRDDQERLFQSFERLGAHVNGSIQGTGLGLRVCRILTEAQGGRIWVESDKNRGSVFSFTLPVAAN